MSDVRLFPSFISETVLQDLIFRIFTKRHRPSLIFILPIITPLHRSPVFQSIHPDTHCVPKYVYFMVQNFCTERFSRHIAFAEIQKVCISRWRSWLRHWATSLNVEVRFPMGSLGLTYHSRLTMALESTQPRQK